MEIEPNKIYIINKLNFASQANVLAKICMTLQYAEKDPIDPYVFLEYVSKGLAFGKCVILVAFNKEQELAICAVLFLNHDPYKGKILWIEWAWSDSKDLKLGLEVLKKIEEVAQKLEADRIAGAGNRYFKVALRYGYKEAYCVWEKLVKKEVKENVEKD